MTAQHRSADARRQDCLRHLCFQRDVTATALTVNAHQNFLVRLQLLADRKQIFRVFDGLLGRAACCDCVYHTDGLAGTDGVFHCRLFL